MPRAYVKPRGLVKRELTNRYHDKLENKRKHRKKNKGPDESNMKGVTQWDLFSDWSLCYSEG